MAFQDIDRAALDCARERGFVYTVIDTMAHNWFEMVFRIEFGTQVAQGFDALEIKGLIEALQRFSGSQRTTIWIDIQTDIIHEALVEAIERSWYFEPNLYVSFKHMASHAPAPQLPERLQAAVEKVASGRRMWHPVLCKEVRTRPSLSRSQSEKND